MRRVHRELAAAVAGVALVLSGTASAQQLVASARPVHFVSTVPPSIPGAGTINGVVSDERGDPLANVMVTVVGEKNDRAITRSDGTYSLGNLPMGRYVIKAHLAGFVVSRSQEVVLGSTIPARFNLQLRRMDGAVGTTGTPSAEPLSSRPIVAAGIELPKIDSAQSNSAEEAEHPHTDAAWRLRHLPRSILKDSASSVVVAENAPDPSAGSLFGRAVGSAASIFTDLPFSGEVNLLTTGALGPELFSTGALPRGVAYFSLGAPTPAGNWLVHAAMSQGDLSSWILAGSFLSDRGGRHSYDLGFSYSTQEYQGGNPQALAAVIDGSRNVGEISAIDRWIFPGVSFEYGTRYSRFDYLSRAGLWSPRIGLTIEPLTGTRVVTEVSKRMVAPGAEEFLAPQVPGPWLPPERTFSPLVPNRNLRIERVGTLDVLLEHDLTARLAIGVRRFLQQSDDQLVTVFGAGLPDGSQSIGHYYLANVGTVAADGWGVRLASLPTQRIHAWVEYTRAHADWTSRPGKMNLVRGLAPSAIRPDLESFHDVTTSFETSFNQDATRVFLLYKINSAYARDNTESTRPGLDGRFDVQVNQALPFGLAGTRWEVLVGLRNLFRDPNDPASVYDELLVVRPPKRVVGGFLVRF